MTGLEKDLRMRGRGGLFVVVVVVEEVTTPLGGVGGEDVTVTTGLGTSRGRTVRGEGGEDEGLDEPGIHLSTVKRKVGESKVIERKCSPWTSLGAQFMCGIGSEWGWMRGQ